MRTKWKGLYTQARGIPDVVGNRSPRGGCEGQAERLWRAVIFLCYFLCMADKESRRKEEISQNDLV